jgi:FkbM family methyltransferase
MSWISRTMFAENTYTVRHGLLKGMKRKGGLGFLPEWVTGADDSPEQRFLSSLDLHGKTVYDVGGFEGLMSMLFYSRGAQSIIAYEPNPRNRNRFQNNLRLNGIANLTLRPVGVGERSQQLEMRWDPATPGAATFSSGGATNASQSEVIHVTTLDEDVQTNSLPVPDFIKIDIEGLELPALKGARSLLEQNHPDLFIELHGETMDEKRENAKNVVGYLTDTGYSKIRHVESGEMVNAANASIAAVGHLFVQR